MSSRPSAQLFLLSAAFLAFACAAEAQQIVNDQFTDGERLTQDVANNSLQWTYGAYNATAANAFTSLTATSGALVWDHVNDSSAKSYSGTWAFFTPSGSPISLTDGQTIRLTFDVTFTNGSFAANNNSFRFGLLNSNGSRVTTDFANNVANGLQPAAGDTSFSTWHGYEASMPLTATGVAGNGFVLRERTGTGNELNTSSNWANLGTSVNETTFALSTTYTGMLQVTRSGSNAIVEGSINGVVVGPATDTVSPYLAFDTINFFATDATSVDITLDNIRLEMVPEPTIAASFLGGAGLLLGLVRRRRSACSVQVFLQNTRGDR